MAREAAPVAEERAAARLEAERVVDRLAHFVLRDVPLQRALLSVPRASRDVPRAVRIPQLDQHRTGTCWMFAGMGFVHAHASRLHCDDEEDPIHIDFAQLYRWHLRALVEVAARRYASALADEEDSGRYRHWADEGVADGGTWGMFCHMIDTHGVPRRPFATDEWPHSAQHSSHMLSYVTAQMRRGASLEDMLCTIDRCLGDDRESRACPPLRLPTPLAEATVQLVNAPDRPTERWYSSPYTNDVAVEAQDPAFNVDIDVLSRVCVHALQMGTCVWASFAVDLTFDRGRRFAGGAANPILPAWPRRSKAERMRRRDVRPEHAMVIVGHDVDPPRWRIVNSWGKRERDKRYDLSFSAVDKGDFYHDVIVTDEWFRENVFHAAVVREACDACCPAISLPPRDVCVLPYHDVLSTVMR